MDIMNNRNVLSELDKELIGVYSRMYYDVLNKTAAYNEIFINRLNQIYNDNTISPITNFNELLTRYSGLYNSQMYLYNTELQSIKNSIDMISNHNYYRRNRNNRQNRILNSNNNHHNHNHNHNHDNNPSFNYNYNINRRNTNARTNTSARVRRDLSSIFDNVQFTRNTFPSFNLFGDTNANTFSLNQDVSNNDFNTTFGNSIIDLLRAFNTPVIVAPTTTQIENAVRRICYRDIPNPISPICPISLERFNNDQTVSQIIHCGHIFNTDGLNEWFQTNVRCPVCRYDIRDYRVDINTTLNSIISRRNLNDRSES